MKYKTCVSIAESSPNKIKIKLKAALKKSDYTEIRLDFLKMEQVPSALEIIKKDLNRIICTLRPKTEGGKFSGTENERIAIIKLIAEYNPFLLDVEFNTLRKNKNLSRYIKNTKTNMLVSWHDFKQTPNISILKKKILQMKKFSNNIKIVTMAKSISDASCVLSLYNNNGVKLIAFSMGNYGRASRLLCLLLGSPYTYVSLGIPIASGQFSVDEVKSIFTIKK